MSTTATPNGKWLSVLIQTGGTLGTMKCTKDVAGGGSTRLSVSGTYVTNDIYTFAPDGTLTHSGTGAPTPTIRTPDRATRDLTGSWDGK